MSTNYVPLSKAFYSQVMLLSGPQQAGVLVLGSCQC